MTRTSISFALLALSAIATPLYAQDDVFKQLKAYDSQQRQAVETLYTQIRQAGSDSAKRAAIETGLLTVLNDPTTTDAGKQEACRMLYEIGTERSVPTLSKMLGDGRTSDSARYALERNLSPDAGKALIAALPSAKGAILLGVINSLGNRGEAGAVTALTAFAKGSDRPAADAAIVALGKIATVDAVTVLKGVPGQELLGQQALLTAADRMARGGKAGDAVKLYESLAGPPREGSIQVGALRGLVVTGQSKRLADLALAALSYSDVRVQTAAANIVSGITDSSIVQRSVTIWPSLPPTAQVPLLAGFTVRKEAGALPLAQQAVSSDDELIRITGIQALAVLDGAKSVPTLGKLAATANGDTKNAARTVLVEMPGVAAEQAIAQAVQQGELSVRLAMLDIVADRATPAGIRLLQETAQGSDEKLASAALKSAVRANVSLPANDLIRVFVTTKSEMVRDAAQSAVVAGAHDSEATVSALAGQLPTASTEVKAAIMTALAQIGGDRALAILTENTRANDADVKGAAITALADTWGDTRPLPTLLTIATSDSNRSSKIQALRGYFRLLSQDEKLPAEEKVAKVKAGIAVAERPEEKRAGLGVLRECRSTGAVELAATALDDPALFDDATDTILFLADKQKKGDAQMPAVKGPATTAALNKIIQKSKDDAIKAQAQKLL